MPILRLVTYIFHLIRLEMFMLNHIFVYLDKHKLLVDEIVIRIRLSFHDGKFPDDFETISTKPGIVSLSSGRKIKKNPTKVIRTKQNTETRTRTVTAPKTRLGKGVLSHLEYLIAWDWKIEAIFRRACSVHLGVKDSCLRRTSSVLLFSLPNMKNVDRHFYLWSQFFSTSLWPRFLDNRWTLRHLSNSVIRLSVRYLTRIAQMDINMNILAKIKMFMTQFC